MKKTTKIFIKRNVADVALQEMEMAALWKACNMGKIMKIKLPYKPLEIGLKAGALIIFAGTMIALDGAVNQPLIQSLTYEEMMEAFKEERVNVAPETTEATTN